LSPVGGGRGLKHPGLVAGEVHRAWIETSS